MFRVTILLGLFVGIVAACNPGPPAPCTVSLEADQPVVTITGESGQPSVRPLGRERLTTSSSVGGAATEIRYTVDRELTYDSGHVYVVTGSLTYSSDAIEHYDLTIDGGRFYEPEFCIK